MLTKDNEFALAETYGRSKGEEFKQAEQDYDQDNQRYLQLRREADELEAELNSSVNIVSEILNKNASVIKPIVMQYPLGLGLQELVDVVAQRLEIPSITVQVFMLGRQDFVFDTCRVWKSKAGIVHWNDADDERNFDERWSRSYIAGWEFSQRQQNKKPVFKSSAN